MTSCHFFYLLCYPLYLQCLSLSSPPWIFSAVPSLPWLQIIYDVQSSNTDSGCHSLKEPSGCVGWKASQIYPHGVRRASQGQLCQEISGSRKQWNLKLPFNNGVEAQDWAEQRNYTVILWLESWSLCTFSCVCYLTISFLIFKRDSTPRSSLLLCYMRMQASLRQRQYLFYLSIYQLYPARCI